MVLEVVGRLSSIKNTDWVISENYNNYRAIKQTCGCYYRELGRLYVYDENLLGANYNRYHRLAGGCLAGNSCNS